MRATLATLALLACGQPADEPLPEPAAAPAPRVKPTPVADAAGLDRVLAEKLERGACRDGKIRLEGVTVVDAADPAHAALLIDRLDAPEVAAAAIVAGVLWDARATIPAERIGAVEATLTALHATGSDALQALHCRKLKNVQGEGIAWNARGDTLALLARMEDREAVEAAIERLATARPELADPLHAALGDADAQHAVNKRTVAQLCTERTWETSWMLRTLDIGKKNGSLLPLGQLQTGACEMLAAGVDPDIVTPRQ